MTQGVSTVSSGSVRFADLAATETFRCAPSCQRQLHALSTNLDLMCALVPTPRNVLVTSLASSWASASLLQAWGLPLPEWDYFRCLSGTRRWHGPAYEMHRVAVPRKCSNILQPIRHVTCMCMSMIIGNGLASISRSMYMSLMGGRIAARLSCMYQYQ